MAVNDIPFFDLKRQIKTMLPELRDTVMGVVESSQFILGDKVKQLEEKTAALVGAKHAVALASGTDGLLLSLIALGVGQGDAVITTPTTFFATASSIVRAGARPVFLDIQPGSMNLDPKRVEEYIAKRCEKTSGGLKDKATGATVKGISPVHIFGLPADMDDFLDIARNNNLFVLEDAAQAIGAWIKDGKGAKRMAGSIGDAAAFSFYPTKNLGAFGDAGMMTTNRDDIADKVRLLRVHGSPARDMFTLVGHLSRMDALQAAILLAKFPMLAGWNKRRIEIAALYVKLIGAKKWSKDVTLPSDLGRGHVYHQFVLRTNRRDDLAAHLRKNGIGCEAYYARPLHLQPALSYLGCREGDLPEAEKAGRESLALPIWPELTDAEIGRIVEALDDFFK